MKQTAKRILTAVLSIMMLLSTLLFVFSCNGALGDVVKNPPRRLDTPGGLRINEEYLEWNPVEYSTRYLVSIDGYESYTEENRYSLAGVSDGEHTFKVRAMGDGAVYESSDYSLPFTVNLIDGSASTSGYYSEFDDLTKNESFLGYGFDVIRSSVFSDKYILMSNPIFDHDELMKQRLLKVDSKNTYVDEIESYSIDEFMQEWNVSANVNVSWGKKKIGGSVDVEAAYSGGSESTASKYFHCITFNNQKFYIVLQSDMDSYRSMLTDGFKKDLYSNMEPSKLFELYGTHFITSAVMGGRINSYYLYTSEEQVDFHDVSAKVSVDVRYLAGKTNVGVDGGYRSYAESQNIDIKNTFEVVGGGDFGMNSDEDIEKHYADWEKSLDSHASLIGIKDTGSLRAIWELIDPALDMEIYEWDYERVDPETKEVFKIEGKGNRAAQLEAFFYAYGLDNYNDLRKSADLPEVVVVEGIQNVTVNDKGANLRGEYDVNSGTVNEIDFSPYPADATSVNKSVALAEDYDFARINSMGKLVVDYDAENGTVIDLILSAGRVTERIKVKITKTCIVEFNTFWPGYEIEQLKVNCRSHIAQPELPERPGYIFIGWYTTSDGQEDTLYKFGNMLIEKDVTLYAKWEEYRPTVSFKQSVLNNLIMDSVSVNYNDTMSEPDAPSCDGYTFIGWYADEDYSKPFDFSTPITKDTTVYVKWEKNPMVSFASNVDGWKQSAQYVEYNTAIDTPDTPELEGYNFVGWYKDAGYSTKYDFNSAITADTTIYAKWEIKTYTVTFNSNGGSSVASYQRIPHGSKIDAPNAPAKSGYEFWGWCEDSACLSKFDFLNDTVTSNITLYAEWGRGGITISFDSCGGDAVEDVRLAQGDSLGESMPSPTRTGYNFVGWYTEKSYSNQVYSSTTFVENDVLYAKWKINSYTVIYNANGGSGYMKDSVFYYGTESALSENTFTRAGYTFIGWNTEADAGNYTYSDGEKVINLCKKNGDIISLYAIWEENDISVTLDANGGSVYPDEISVTYGGFYGELPTPDRAGYEFLGWYTAKAGGTKITEQTQMTSAASHTLYAHWKILTYKIVYDLNGGTFVENGNYPSSYTVEDLPLAISDLIDANYPDYNHFVDWHEGNGIFVDDLSSNPRDLTLTASWDMCELYTDIAATPEIKHERAIIDWRNYMGTDVETARGNAVISIYNVSGDTQEVIFIGDPYAVYTKMKIELVGFAEDQELIIRFVNFNYITNQSSAISPSESDDGMILTIEVNGKCSIASTYSGGNIISDFTNTVNLTGSGNMTITAGAGADASSGGANGQDGGMGIKAENVVIDMTGELTVIGGNGGNGAEGSTGSHTSRAGDGGDGGNGGMAIISQSLSMINSNTKLQIIGGNGGSGGKGGNIPDGSDQEGKYDIADAGFGGDGGDGGAPMDISKLKSVDCLELVMKYGNGGNGGEGGHGGNPKVCDSNADGWSHGGCGGHGGNGFVAGNGGKGGKGGGSYGEGNGENSVSVSGYGGHGGDGGDKILGVLYSSGVAQLLQADVESGLHGEYGSCGDVLDLGEKYDGEYGYNGNDGKDGSVDDSYYNSFLDWFNQI